jgi:hypothetical protein
VRIFQIGPIQPHPERELSQPLIEDLYDAAIKDIVARFSIPTKMAQAAQSAAILAYEAPDEESRWTNFLWLCIILVQGRPPGITEAELVARVELDDILMREVFDHYRTPDKENKTWIFS